MSGIASSTSGGLLIRGGPGCSLVHEGLGLAGLAGGDDFALTNFVGVETLDSLDVGLWPGLAFGNVRFGDPTMVLGVTAFRTCGGLASIGSVPLRTSYGPAVFGRGGISGRFLTGLTGAPDKPPAFGRVVVDDAAVEVLDTLDSARFDRGGEISIADPGLGRDVSMAEPGLFAMEAFF